MAPSSKKVKCNLFIDDEAGEADGEEEEEEEEEDGVDGFVKNDDEISEDEDEDEEFYDPFGAFVTTNIAVHKENIYEESTVTNHHHSTNVQANAEAEHLDAERISAQIARRARQKGAPVGDFEFLEDLAVVQTVEELAVGVPLWQVRVKPGKEDDVVFFIMNETVSSSVADIEQGHRSCVVFCALHRSSISPGFVYVEAPSYRDVRRVCDRSIWYRGGISPLPFKDALKLLKAIPPSFRLKPNSWVRIRGGRYKGDVAYLEDVLSAESIAVIKVIPRIDSEKLPTCPSPLSREAANSISKDITGRKRKRRNRPAAKLFNPHEWPKEHVKEISVGTAEAHNFLDSSVGLGQYKYRGYLYTNGLLEREVPLCSVVFDPTTPTWDELQSWSGCADHHIRRYAMNQLVHFTAKLWEQDRVQVTAGDYQGREGKVQRVEKEEVIILLSWLDEVLSLPIAHVRKVFKVGDFVIVKVGNDCNRQGWVVEVVEAGDQRQLVVINELATSTVISSVPDRLSLQLPPVITEAPSVYCPSPLDLALRHHSKCIDPWQGMAVRIMKGANKGYGGYITATHKVFEKFDLPREFFLTPDTLHSAVCPLKCESCRLRRPCMVDHMHCQPCFRVRMVSIQASRVIEDVSVVVRLNNGQSTNLDICQVRPADDILPVAAWLQACRNKHHRGYPLVPHVQQIGILPEHRRRWEKAIEEMIYWQQWFGHKSFVATCQLHPGCDEEVRNGNWFWFVPPWYSNIGDELAALATGDRRPYIQILSHDENDSSSAASPNLPDRPATPRWEEPSGWEPAPEEVPGLPDEIFHVGETWLDRDLRKLPLFICMARGSRAYSKSFDGAVGKIIVQGTPASNADDPTDGEDPVDVYVMGPMAQNLRSISIKHLVPKYPEQVGEHAAFISGPRKGEIVCVKEVVGDSLMVKRLGKGANKKPTTRHSKYELVASQLPSRKR